MAEVEMQPTDEEDILQTATPPQMGDGNPRPERNASFLAVLLVAESSNLPVELQDGIAQFVQFYPHKNFVTEDIMRDSDSEVKWNVM